MYVAVFYGPCAVECGDVWRMRERRLYESLSAEPACPVKKIDQLCGNVAHNCRRCHRAARMESHLGYRRSLVETSDLSASGNVTRNDVLLLDVKRYFCLFQRWLVLTVTST